MGWEKRQTHFLVKATTRGLGTDLRYYEPTANATFRVVWRLEWNGKNISTIGTISTISTISTMSTIIITTTTTTATTANNSNDNNSHSGRRRRGDVLRVPVAVQAGDIRIYIYNTYYYCYYYYYYYICVCVYI